MFFKLFKTLFKFLLYMYISDIEIQQKFKKYLKYVFTLIRLNTRKIKKI